MSSEVLERTHPVLDLAVDLGERLDQVVASPLWSMRPEEQRAALVKLAEDEAKLTALRLRLLAEADASGATDPLCSGTAADWVAGETRQTRRAARSDLRLGKKLETSYPLLGCAFDQGCVNEAQTRVIAAALDKLPTTGAYALAAEQLVEAEQHLVEKAAVFDADTLKMLGDRIFEVIAPDLAEAYEGRRLEAQEARALRKAEFDIWEDPQGICHGRFRVSHLHGHMLTKMISAFTNPAHPHNQPDSQNVCEDSGIDPDLPAEVRRGLGFMALIESVDAKDLPRTGGVGATVVVTMTLEQLLTDLDAAGVCTLDTGGRISASEARRLACAAGIIPVVLDGASQVLDVGRRRRFHTQAMRVAMGIRDQGCTAEGCTAPPGMCHAHHDQPWSQGGHTDITTGRLLCPHHHRRIHHTNTRTEPLPNGEVRFHRRE